MHPQSTLPRWTPQEDQFLRDNVQAMTHAAMGAILGRTRPAVRNRVWRLRLVDTSARWLPEHVAQLKAYYAAHVGSWLNLHVLAAQMGRTEFALVCKAQELGLADMSRPRFRPQAWSADEDAFLWQHRDMRSADVAMHIDRTPMAIIQRRRVLGCPLSAEALRALAQQRWRLYQHPRGALGMRHSPEGKAKMSAAHKAAWARAKATGTSFMSEENRQLRSDAMALRQATDPRLRQGFSRAAGGTRADLGFYVRSRWEANIARYLKWLQERGEIYSWAYESTTFWFEEIKRGTRSYLPDFEIVEREGDPSHFWEVKGWDHPRGKTALARMARYHPEVRITVIDQEAYKAIAKWKALIPHWEVGHGSHRD